MASEHFERALARGRIRFERHEWLAAHDVWEEGWKLTTDGDERLVLQSLALWATAASQHLHAGGDVARRLLLRSLEHVSQVRSELSGLAESLNEAMVGSLEALGLPWTPQSHQWPEEPTELLPFVELEHRDLCPYCGEPVLLTVAAEDSNSAQYVEDCPVCCRPLDVTVHQGKVTLSRDDAPS